MNTAARKPADSAPQLRPNGLNQDSDGWTARLPACPAYTLIRQTTEKTASVSSSTPSRITWVRADSSIPTHEIQVITAIQMQPTIVVAHRLFARLSSPNSEKLYWPAIWARLAMTMTSAATITQPLI